MNLPTFEEEQLDALLAESDVHEPEEPVVGWVVWKDGENVMVIFSDEDGRPRLFSSYDAAKQRQGLLDVVVPVTQERYDELCGREAAEVEEHLLAEDDIDEDPQESWVQSILAEIDRRVSTSAESAVGSRPAPPKQAEIPDRLLPGGPRARGFVYVVSTGARVGLYKIGRSKNPKRRLKAIRESSPVDVTLECSLYTSDMGLLEALLHQRFARQREHSEWFRLSYEDLVWIRSLDVSRMRVLQDTHWSKWPTLY